MNIHVSNLGKQVTEESLNATFSTYGVVQSANIMLDQFTEEARRFALVNMPIETEAELAIEKLNDAVVDGRHLVVKQDSVIKVLAGSCPTGKRARIY